MKTFDFTSMRFYQPVNGAGTASICDDAGGCNSYRDCDGGSQYDD